MRLKLLKSMTVVMFILLVAGFTTAKIIMPTTSEKVQDSVIIDRNEFMDLYKNPDGSKTLQIFSYEKNYWNESNNEWEVIDENFFQCGSNFCTKDYFFKVETEGENIVSYEKSSGLRKDRRNLTMTISNIMDKPLNKNWILKDGILKQILIPDYIELEYKFHPRKLKESLIIKKMPSISKDFNIIFTVTGNADFFEGEAVICDDNGEGECQIWKKIINGKQNIIKVNLSWMKDRNRVFPLVIDPVIHLNSSNITWDGTIHFQASVPAEYTRTTTNPNKVGCLNSILIHTYRSDIDWNVSLIPDGSKVVDAVMKTNTNKLGTTGNRNVSLYHMEGHNTTYSTADNILFYKDMKNGTIYDSNLFTSKGTFTWNLTSPAYGDIENAINGDDVFSVGISSNPQDCSAGSTENRFASSEAGTVKNRPHLNITYFEQCDYSGTGNWDINCTSNCTIDLNTNLQNNNLTINGSGRITLTNNVTNFTRITVFGIDSSNICYVQCTKDGCFRD